MTRYQRGTIGISVTVAVVAQRLLVRRDEEPWCCRCAAVSFEHE